MTSPITSPAFLELQRLLNLNFDASNRIYHRRRTCIMYIQHLQTEMIKCQEKKPRIICLWENPFTASYFEDLFWLLNGSQLSTSFCKQMTGSSMLKTGRQQVDHLVYLIWSAYVAQCLQRRLCLKLKIHATISTGSQLMSTDIWSTNSSLSLSIDQSLVHTKWCKWTWKENAF